MLPRLACHGIANRMRRCIRFSCATLSLCIRHEVCAATIKKSGTRPLFQANECLPELLRFDLDLVLHRGHTAYALGDGHRFIGFLLALGSTAKRDDALVSIHVESEHAHVLVLGILTLDLRG